jgi:diguanylate cyclase (GGDEF)-like protein
MLPVPRFHDLKLRDQFIVATALVVVCLVGQTAFAYRTAAQSREAVAWVDHTERVIQLADEAQGALVEMENAYRGFLVVGRIDVFEPFEAGRLTYLSRLAALKRETADNPPQVQRWLELERREARWEQEVTMPGMALRWQVVLGTGTMDPVIERAVADRAQFDAMRRVFAEAVASEESLLAQRTEAAAAANQQLQVVLVWGTIATTAVGMLVAILVARSLNGGLRRLVHASERMMRGDLGQRIHANRRDELGDASAAFDRMANQIQDNSARREALLRIFRQLATDDDTERVLADLLDGAVDLLHVAGAAVFRWDGVRDGLEPVARTPEAPASLEFVPAGRGIIGDAVERRATLIETAYGQSETALPSLVQAGAAACLVVGLAHQGKTVGALAAWHTDPARRFEPQDAAVLEILGAVGAATLARRQQADLLRQHAETDALTGLVNRRKAAEWLDALLELAGRQEQALTLAIVDLDHFKDLNDRCGHEMGDRVLQRVSDLLERSFRAEDVVARWGGEEFVIGLHAATREDAVWRLEHVLAMLSAEDLATPGADPVRITFSGGVAQYPSDGATLSELLRAADGALYKAKHSGRARVMMAASPGHLPAPNGFAQPRAA